VNRTTVKKRGDVFLLREYSAMEPPLVEIKDQLELWKAIYGNMEQAGVYATERAKFNQWKILCHVEDEQLQYL
jgi:hypothetical protein